MDVLKLPSTEFDANKIQVYTNCHEFYQKFILPNIRREKYIFIAYIEYNLAFPILQSTTKLKITRFQC